MGNMVTHFYSKSNYHRLRIDKALGNFRKPDNNSKNKNKNNVRSALVSLLSFSGPKIHLSEFSAVRWSIKVPPNLKRVLHCRVNIGIETYQQTKDVVTKYRIGRIGHLRHRTDASDLNSNPTTRWTRVGTTSWSVW